MSLLNILLIVFMVAIIVGSNLYSLKQDRDIAKERKKREQELNALYQKHLDEMLTGLNEIKPLRKDLEITFRTLANQAANTNEPQFMLLFLSLYLLHTLDAGFNEFFTNLKSRGL